MSPSFHDYRIIATDIVNGSRAQYERGIADQRRHDVAPWLDLDKSVRVLDLGNGQLRPQYALLKADGHQVCGIDLINRAATSGTDWAYRIARWLYNRHIHLPQSASERLVCGDVSTLPFADNHFDLITSVAAFEHFLNVPAVVIELQRVLREGGMVWVEIHLFSSPSGGHTLNFTGAPLNSMPLGLDPWDHLRQRKLPFTVPLNEWRRDQYLAEFARHFEILKHYCLLREGEPMLTPQIEAELPGYDRNELTCKTYIIVARKPIQEKPIA